MSNDVSVINFSKRIYQTQAFENNGAAQRIKDCCRASHRAATKSGVELSPQVQVALFGISMRICVR